MPSSKQTKSSPCVDAATDDGEPNNDHRPILWIPRHLYNRWFTKLVVDRLAAEADALQSQIKSTHPTEKKKLDRLKLQLKSANDVLGRADEEIRHQTSSQWKREDIAAEKHVVVRRVSANPAPEQSNKQWIVTESDWIVEDIETDGNDQEQMRLWRDSETQAPIKNETFRVKVLEFPDNIDILHRSIQLNNKPNELLASSLNCLITYAILNDEWILAQIKGCERKWNKEAENYVEALQIVVEYGLPQKVISKSADWVKKGYDMRRMLTYAIRQAFKNRTDTTNSPKKPFRELRTTFDQIQHEGGKTVGDRIDRFIKSGVENASVQKQLDSLFDKLVEYGRAKLHVAKPHTYRDDDREIIALTILGIENYCLNHEGETPPYIVDEYIENAIDDHRNRRDDPGYKFPSFPVFYRLIAEELLHNPVKPKTLQQEYDQFLASPDSESDFGQAIRIELHHLDPGNASWHHIAERLLRGWPLTPGQKQELSAHRQSMLSEIENSKISTPLKKLLKKLLIKGKLSRHKLKKQSSELEKEQFGQRETEQPSELETAFRILFQEYKIPEIVNSTDPGQTV